MVDRQAVTSRRRGAVASRSTSSRACRFGVVFSAVVCYASAVVVVVAQPPAAADAEPSKPDAPTASPSTDTPASLFDQEPYDLLVLKDAKKTQWKLVPLDLPRRRLPVDPDPASLLQVRLFESPEKKYEVAWRDIAEVRLFEQLLLDEARRLMRERKYLEAYDFVVHFRRDQPHWAEVDEVEADLLRSEAEATLDGGDVERAVSRLVRLTELKDRNARTRELFARASQQQFEAALKVERFAEARAVVERFLKSYPREAESTTLRNMLSEEADRRAATAEQALVDKRYEIAQAEARAAVLLDDTGGKRSEMFRRCAEARRIVHVGVVETVVASAHRAADTWAERRLADLRRPALLRPILSTGETPKLTYESPTCKLTADDRDPTLWHLRTEEGAPLASDVAAALVEVPGAKSQLVPFEIEPLDRRSLGLRLQRAHPQFEAMIADRLRTATFSSAAPAPFDVVEESSAAGDAAQRASERLHLRRRVLRNDGTVDEIVEHRFADETAAVRSLLAGRIDVVDRAAPWQVAELRGRKDVALKPYAAASVHLLLFDGKHPLLQDVQFRRAVAYAIDRESILRNHLRPEAGDLGSRLATGVFPVGRSASDPLGYANDLTAKARAYEPTQAYVLAALAKASLGKSPAAAVLRPLKLLHPSTATATTACRRIAYYLSAAGIPVELQAVAADRSPTSAGEADLVYAVVSSVEPASDALAWLGTSRLVNIESPSLQSSLAKLASAESPSAVRSVLFEIQRTINDEVLVVPLWQLSEYAIHRGRITVGGAKPSVFGLYQDVDAWQVSPRVSEAAP